MDKATEQFERDVHATVMKALPGLIAEQMASMQTTSSVKTSTDRRQQIVSMRQKGLSQREIAEALDTTQPYVSLILKKSGMSVRTRSAKSDGQGSLQKAWQKHGSKSAAAKALGLSESTYRDRLKKEMNR